MNKFNSQLCKQEEETHQKIYNAALRLLFQSTLEETYPTIVKEAIKLVGAQHGSIFFIKEGKIDRVYTTLKTLQKVTPRLNGNTWKVYSKRKPYLLKGDAINILHPQLDKLHINSDIGIPLAYDKKIFGVLSILATKGSPLTQSDVSLLQMFSPLATLAIQNAELYSDLKRVTKSQDLFLSMAAHELKTPLTSLALYIELLLKGVEPKQLSPRSLPQKINLELHRLNKLTNELLQVSNIRKGKLQFSMRKCNIHQIIEQAVASAQNANITHSMRFENKVYRKNVYVYGDEDKLMQVIINLLNNAAKFSTDNTVILVALKKNARDITIEIKDKGIGIQKKNINKIFEGFYKVSQQKKPGLGLGLYLVKNIIDNHHGTIHVQSQMNKGTTFTITLPVYRND